MPVAVEGDHEEDDYIVPSQAASSPPISPTSGLPLTVSPTVTLLRKAREGSAEKQASPSPAPPPPPPKQDRTGSSGGDRNANVDSSDQVDLDFTQKHHQLTNTRRVIVSKGPAPKIHGVGPTENGVPITPRPNVDDEHGSDWYRTMYKRLHTYKKPDQEVITVRVRRGLSHYRDDGYVSEPEHSSIERRRFSEKRWPYEYHDDRDRSYSSYKVTPKRIEDYQPGESSVTAADASVQRDKMYHSNRYNPPVPSPPKPTYVFNENDSYKMVKLAQDLPSPRNVNSGYTQREWYRSVQKGHDIPIGGLRRPQAPPPRDYTVGPCPAVQQHSPYGIDFSDTCRYLENTNLTLEREFEDLKAIQRRQELSRMVDEESLMKRRIQNDVDRQLRRQYDALMSSPSGGISPISPSRHHTTDGTIYETVFYTPDNREVIMLGRVIYDFIAHAPKELNLKRGDLVYIFKKIDRNWYYGECLGRIGIFPVRYVDAFPPSSFETLANVRVVEGSAVGRFNFTAKNPTELSFRVGDRLQLVRRIDHNWFEARFGVRRGLVPANYLTIQNEPTEIRPKQ